MKALDVESFTQLLTAAPIKPRLKKDVRFTVATSAMTPEDWNETELLAIPDRSGRRGVLLLAPGSDVHIVAYEISKGMASKQTGRAQPVICDFCRTWQAGSGAGSITFSKNKQSLDSVGFLCCADLQCNKHVRGKTTAARLARAQLREDITDEQRVERLRKRLYDIIEQLEK